MLDQDTIEQQKALLNQHRRRLALLFQQQSRLGEYTPPHILLEIEDTQTVIRELKETLSTADIAVEDEPNDNARPTVVATPSYLTPQERRNRGRMLQKVRDLWIKGVLEDSLHGAVLIELGLEAKPEFVVHPLELIVEQPDAHSQSISEGTRIIDIFAEQGGELLVLGPPGAGKTTLLLELARTLLERAEHDETLPMPVIFNLASWSKEQPPLIDWLIDELNERYDVPKPVGRKWIDTDQMLLLLDGLDEVRADYRADRIEAINAFRHEHGMVPIVVCSRLTDYEALTTRLKLRGAVYILPLTSQQIDAYLESMGDKVEGFRQAIQMNTILRELAQSPLMLSILTLTYHGVATEDLATAFESDNWRNDLFAAYVQRMLKRPYFDAPYSPQQTVRWLSWLAKAMVRHNQSVFHLERMQPDWFSTLGQRRLYNVGVSVCLGVINVPVGGILGTMVGGSISGLIGGIIGGIGVGMAYWRRVSAEPITIVENLRWSWSNIRPTLRRSLGGGAILALVGSIIVGLVRGVSSGFVGGILIGLVFILIGGLSGGIGSDEAIDSRTRPNQGIWRSATNALRVGVSVGLIGGLVGGTVVGLFFQYGIRLPNGWAIGMAGALAVSLLSALHQYGGQTCLRHGMLRLILWYSGAIPWNYARFLDYCAERIFLRKVGGGYIFIHRMLMEYFAELETTTEEASAKSS